MAQFIPVLYSDDDALSLFIIALPFGLIEFLIRFVFSLKCSQASMHMKSSLAVQILYTPLVL